VTPDYYQEIFDGMIEDDDSEAIDRFLRNVLDDPKHSDKLDSMIEGLFDF